MQNPRGAESLSLVRKLQEYESLSRALQGSLRSQTILYFDFKDSRYASNEAKSWRVSGSARPEGMIES
jgi:hypothetical protein